jgi:hypothetical protein
LHACCFGSEFVMAANVVTTVVTMPYLVKCRSVTGWPLRAAMPSTTTSVLAATGRAAAAEFCAKGEGPL